MTRHGLKMRELTKIRDEVAHEAERRGFEEMEVPRLGVNWHSGRGLFSYWDNVMPCPEDVVMLVGMFRGRAAQIERRWRGWDWTD